MNPLAPVSLRFYIENHGSFDLIESEVAMEVGAEKKKKKEDDFALFPLFYVTSTLPVIQGCTVHT